jgi:phosphomannomutase
LLRAEQGVAEYLKGILECPRVLIGHDHRHNSRAFAQVAADTLHTAGCKVYLIQEDGPTPLIVIHVL